MWMTYCCLVSFFRLSIRALVAEIQPDKVVRWCSDGDFLRPIFPASRVEHISDMHSKFALGHTMCRSMADIHSATAEIRRGKRKKEERKKEETTGQQYNGLHYYIGRP